MLEGWSSLTEVVVGVQGLNCPSEGMPGFTVIEVSGRCSKFSGAFEVSGSGQGWGIPYYVPRHVYKEAPKQPVGSKVGAFVEVTSAQQGELAILP